MRRIQKLPAWLVAAGHDSLRRLGRQMPWYVADASPEGRNIHNLNTETVWFGLLNGVAATFVPVFALRLGATTGQIGWLTALPALVNVVWLIPAARIIERQHRRLPLILQTGLLQRLGYLAMAAMPLFVVTGRVEALIIINTLITVPTAVISTAVTSLLPDLTSPERRGRVVSARWLLLSASATVAALGGGWFLDLVPVPLNYQLLLGFVTLLSLLSLRYLRRIQVPDTVLARRAARPRERYAWRRISQSLAGILTQRAFIRFSLASFVFYWGLYLPGALWPVLRVRELGASDSMVGVIAVVIDASTIGGYYLWGRVIASRGNRWVFIVAGLGISGYAFVSALVPTIGWLVPPSLLSGLSWAGCNLVLFNLMLSVPPEEHRPTYIALYTALMNLTAFVAPLLGAALSDWIGIRTAFVVASGVRTGGVLLFAWLVR